MIGAGSVVTKDVPDFALVVGNPSKTIGWIGVKCEKLPIKNDGDIFENENGIYQMIDCKINFTTK